MDNEKIMVVDNFCDFADELVDSVKAAGFGTWTPTKGLVGSSIYEGMGFWGLHSVAVRSIIKHLGQVIVPNNMFFRTTNVGFEPAYIHSDRDTGAHTCILYLSDHDEPFGTAFFKHLPTGLTEMPSFAEMQEMGIMEQMVKDMVSRDPEVWEQVGYIEGKYNRGIIFDAPLFHSRFPVEGIGDTEDEGRLVWASHFYKMRGNGEFF